MRVAQTIALVLGALVGGAAAGAASLQPSAGTYDQYQVVIASSGPGCDPVGTTLGGYFTYPGPAKAGAQSFGGIEDKADNVMHMQVCDYPPTPAAGATTWSGSATCTDFFPTGPNTQFDETFSWTIKYVDKNSFLVEKKIGYPLNGGTCNETRNEAYVRTGK